MKSVFLSLLVTISCALAACGKSQAPAADAHEAGDSHESGNDHAEAGVHAGSRPVPREAGEGQGGGEEIAMITQNAATAAGIEILAAAPAKLRESIPLYGGVVPNAERTRNVSARYAGVVKSVEVASGDQVKVGDRLATVESNDSLQVYAVTAPIAGVVTARNVNPGESVAEQALFTITDLSTVWVELSAFPREMAQIRVGQSVQVSSADGGLSGRGRIVFVSSLGSAATQSTTARVLLDNAQRLWTPGLYVSADVILQEVDIPVAVKSQALQSVDGERVVFIAVEGGFAPRSVRSGRSDGEITEILTGIRSGERYVSANSFVVKSELAKADAGHDH